ncbi:Pt1-cadherin-like protein, partial [Leptotrombidium deliense]
MKASSYYFQIFALTFFTALWAPTKADWDTDDVSDAIQVSHTRFVRPAKRYEFKESDGASSGTFMFNLDTKDSQEVFKLKSSNRWVTVDSNGTVRVKEPWDYEQLKNKTIYFGVFVALPNRDIEHQSITIHIIDVNDEPPEFINQPLPMQTVVDLNAPPGTSVFKLQANDPDTDHNIHYLLVRDRTGGRFEVDELSGE